MKALFVVVHGFSAHSGGLLSVPCYFLFLNLNVFRGISYLARRHESGTWEKEKRV